MHTSHFFWLWEVYGQKGMFIAGHGGLFHTANILPNKTVIF